MPVNKRRTLKKKISKKMSKKLKRRSLGGMNSLNSSYAKTKTSMGDNSTVILDPMTGDTVYFPNKQEAIKYNRHRSTLKNSPKKIEVDLKGRKIKSLVKRKSSTFSTSSDSDKTKNTFQTEDSILQTPQTPQTPLTGTIARAI